MSTGEIVAAELTAPDVDGRYWTLDLAEQGTDLRAVTSPVTARSTETTCTARWLRAIAPSRRDRDCTTAFERRAERDG